MENDKASATLLGTEKIGKLLFKYALPSIIAMIAVSIYNVVDSIFIGHAVGALALSGLAITFPFMNIIGAFATLVAMGASALTSMRLGQKDYESTKLILGNTVTLNIIFGLLITLTGYIFLDPILNFFGASKQILPYAHDFMKVYLIGSVFSQLFFGLNSLIRVSGAPQKSMYAIIITILITIILNPLFLFVLKLGVMGSALATVISQAVMCCWEIGYFLNKNSSIHLQRSALRLKKNIISDALSIGLAPFLLHVASCVLVIIINKGLNKYGGDMAIGAFGIINRFSFIFGMIVIGFTQGMQPIVGYNYGAKQYSRVIKTFKITIICGCLVNVIGFLFAELTPGLIASVFTNDKTLIHAVIVGMQLFMIAFPLSSIQMVADSFFQSIGKAKQAIFLSLTRQLIIILPAILILPLFFGLKGIWISMPVSDVLAALISASMLYFQLHKIKYQPETLQQI